MTVHALPRPAVTPLIGDARAVMTSAAAVPVEGLGAADIEAGIEAAAALESQATAMRMALTAEADRRQLADQQAATGTDAWAAALTGDTREAMNGGLWIANLLATTYAATREAFAAGRLRLPQVRVIVAAAEKIPAWATPAQVAAAEEWLVAKATGDGNRNGRPQNPKRLRQTARNMCKVVSAELATAHATAMLTREAKRAENETWFNLSDNGDGTYAGRFVIPELHGKLLKGYLERLTSPRRWSRDKKTGALLEDPTLPGTGPGLSYTEHLGSALCEAIEHLPVDGHAANSVSMLVTIDLDSLLSGLGIATLDEGITITAGDARRMACEAGLIPAVLNRQSVPLDLGRKQRLHSTYQRLALSLKHDTCAITGCHRPFAWCEIHHHKIPWSRGGPTDLANGLPLCGFHHRRAHDDEFELRQTAHGDWRFHPRR